MCVKYFRALEDASYKQHPHLRCMGCLNGPVRLLDLACGLASFCVVAVEGYQPQKQSHALQCFRVLTLYNGELGEKLRPKQRIVQDSCQLPGSPNGLLRIQNLLKTQERTEPHL